MENRRDNAKNQILSKLRKNQDFLMNTTVSSKPQMWTKWHQERMVNNEVTKSISELKNKRYATVGVSPLFTNCMCTGC